MLDLPFRAIRFGTHLYRLTTTLSERLSLARFILRYALARLLPGFVVQDDTELRLHGTHYVIGASTSEIFSLDELYFHRDYDKVNGFIPEPGWVVFDVGANVGVYACEQARRNATVYAFEPNPDCFRRLQKMLELNHLGSQVHAFNVALGSAPGRGNLSVELGRTTSGTVVLEDEQTASIDVTTLDIVVPSLMVGHIDLLKIDVEGSELDVLRGSMNTLSIVDRIVVEYHSYELYTQVKSLTRAAGFDELLRADENQRTGLGLAYYAKPTIV